MRTRRFIILAASAVALYAGQPWSKDYRAWTDQDVQHLLVDSPWAKLSQASFNSPAAEDSAPPTGPNSGAAAGMAGPGSTVMWNGQPGRPLGDLPSLPVIVRWESALPIRQALLRQTPADTGSLGNNSAYTIALLGLWPGKPGVPDGPAVARMRAEMIQTARFLRRGKPPLIPIDVQLTSDTGTIRLVFPRTDPITVDDKEITFSTRFGPMTIQKKFRLKEMIYHGKLEL